MVSGASAALGERVRHRPGRREPDRGQDGHREQHSGDGRTVEARDVAQPRRHPEPLGGEERGVTRHADARDAPEHRIAVDRPEPPDELAHARPHRARVALRHDEEDQRRGRERQRGEAVEDAAPVGEPQQRLDRRRSRERAEAAGREEPAAQRGEARHREPQRERLHARHQATGHAEPDQRSAGDQSRKGPTRAEDESAARGDDQQPRVHAARAEAVEEDAERQLERREREEVRAGEQAQAVRVDADVAYEIRPDDGVDGAEEVRKVVAAGERHEHAREDPQRQSRFLFGHQGRAGSYPTRFRPPRRCNRLFPV